MKKIFSLIILALFGWLIACGPAAEDRQKMHNRAKEFQDSIANFIRQRMNEAEMQPNGTVRPLDTAAARIAREQTITPNPNHK